MEGLGYVVPQPSDLGLRRKGWGADVDPTGAAG